MNLRNNIAKFLVVGAIFISAVSPSFAMSDSDTIEFNDNGDTLSCKIKISCEGDTCDYSVKCDQKVDKIRADAKVWDEDRNDKKVYKKDKWTKKVTNDVTTPKDDDGKRKDVDEAKLWVEVTNGDKKKDKTIVISN